VTPLLTTKGVTVRFGGLTAVDNVDLAVPEGVIHGVIGPNGAGKTTFFNAITGLAQISDGAIGFAGADITRQPTYRRARGLRIFRSHLRGRTMRTTFKPRLLVLVTLALLLPQHRDHVLGEVAVPCVVQYRAHHSEACNAGRA